MKKQDNQPKSLFFSILALSIFTILSSLFSFYFWTDTVDSSYPNGAMTTYITATGEKYHLSGCSYLEHSSRKISLEDARAKGYGSCSRCKPPMLITESEYQQRKDDQFVIALILLGLLTSAPLTLVFMLVVAKINDFIGFLNNFPDWFFLASFITVYVSICIQYLRVCIIW